MIGYTHYYAGHISALVGLRYFACFLQTHHRRGHCRGDSMSLSDEVIDKALAGAFQTDEEFRHAAGNYWQELKVLATQQHQDTKATQEEEKALATHLSRAGRQEKVVAGDGNCAFYSVAHQWAEYTGQDQQEALSAHPVLRELVCDIICASPTLWLRSVLHNDNMPEATFLTMVQEHRKPG